MKKNRILFIILTSLLFISCNQKSKSNSLVQNESTNLSIVATPEVTPKKVLPGDIQIEKAFLYDKYTLEDSYPYNNTTREFQWDKIKDHLAMVNSAQLQPHSWAILQNRRNIHGEAPKVKNATTDKFNHVEDAYGVEENQSIPLYGLTDINTPERYGRDGSWVQVLGDSADYVKVRTIYFDGDWMVPSEYVHPIESSVINKVVMVDRTNQNIATLEYNGSKWLVRSMNKATTGLENPPFQKETPLGIFVVQEKKDKMLYLVDGTQTIAGYAPYASRFSNGGYIHGVPVNNPNGALIETSPTLGTTPRSHMCVRTATSHAKFIYDWAPVGEALVIVIE